MASCYKRVNFYDLCRLCAQNIYKHKINIFEQEGVKNQLQAKIKKCLSINVKEDDFLPKVVCYKCIKQLDMCNTFREECLNSETMLSSYFQNYRETEEFKQFGQVYIKDVNVASELALAAIKGQTTKPTEQGKKPESTRNSAEQSKSKNESQSTSSRNSIQVERRHLTTTEELISQTEHIVQVPLTFDSLNEAIKKVVQQLPKEFLNKVIVNSNGEVINLFPQEMIQVNQQQQHNTPHRVHKHKSMKRTKEKKVYSPTPQLYENIIKIDLTEENIDDVDKLLKHENPVPPQACSTPSVIFPVPHPQSTHFQNTTFSHSTEDEEDNNNYFAHSTGVIPSTSENPVINMGCNNEDNNIDEPITPPGAVLLNDSSSSVNMEELQAEEQESHIKIHTCEECSKKFRRREHLYQHMKLHSGFRPYQCSECKKTFVRKEHLLRHTVLHSGERNFSCDICGKSFSRHDNLLKHIRTHNKEPSYTCERCQKVFIIKHYYDAHCADHEKGVGPILRITV